MAKRNAGPGDPNELLFPSVPFPVPLLSGPTPPGPPVPTVAEYELGARLKFDVATTPPAPAPAPYCDPPPPPPPATTKESMDKVLPNAVVLKVPGEVKV
jgi:hypothetical protein